MFIFIFVSIFLKVFDLTKTKEKCPEKEQLHVNHLCYSFSQVANKVMSSWFSNINVFFFRNNKYIANPVSGGVRYIFK